MLLPKAILLGEACLGAALFMALDTWRARRMDERITVNGKVVGEVIDGMYFTQRDMLGHYYRKGSGYPISVSVLDGLKHRGIGLIRIIETGRPDSRIVLYEAKVSDYDKAEPFKEGGYDMQKCIPLKSMKTIRGNSGGLWDWIFKKEAK